ncbi:MAG: RloB family protein [Verrucomicrobia bacterium]|nr:RloB family protein [Verrucomicrobiota bacterium]
MSCDLPWWQVAKAQSLERRAREAAAASGVNAGDAFLIVTEGTVTEPIYFELLRQDLQLVAVRIRVEPGRASHPRHVIETAAAEVKEHARRSKKGLLANTEPAKFDHVWAVIDADVAVRDGIWNEVEALAKVRKVKLAHSTPCFEYWLLLHIQGFTTRGDLIDGDTAKHAVKHALGMEYSTNEETVRAIIPSFLDKWPEAVVHGERVRKHHEAAATPIPANPSTEVCTLVRVLNDSAPTHLRRL